jgi:hypothetical protein
MRAARRDRELCNFRDLHLVFPRADGSMQRADTKLSRTLRTAFKAAGVITGYSCTADEKGAVIARAQRDFSRWNRLPEVRLQAVVRSDAEAASPGTG